MSDQDEPKELRKSIKNRQERRKTRTRTKLKEATLELVLEVGYEGVTIQDIVERADLGRGTFYLHFRDKEDVVWALIIDAFEATPADSSRKYRVGSYPPGYLGFLMTFENADAQRELYRLMLGTKGSALLTNRAAQRLVDQIEGSIRAGMYGIGVDLPAEIQAQFVVGAMVRLMVWWLETSNDFTPEDMANMLYLLIHREQVSAS
jgi:AcrR family transcriptional regulator